jgi:hypothetical protein
MSELLQRRRSEGCLSDLALDRLVAGELSAVEGSALATHLTGCDSCANRLRAHRQEAVAFGEEVWLEGLARRTERAVRRRPFARVAAWSGAIAIAAALLVWIRLPEHGSIERRKGGTVLEVIARKADGRIERLLPGAPVRPGESMRFRLSSDREGSFALLGLDAAGGVTPYLSDGSGTRPLRKGTQLLEGSIIADDTLGPERVFAVICDQAMPIDRVVDAGRRALREAGGDPRKLSKLDLACRQSSFLIEKVVK